MKKYYRVFFYITDELREKFGKFITYYARDVVVEVVNMSLEEIKKVSIEVVDEFYKNKSQQVAVYIDKEIYDKWKSIPWHLKKQAQYLINKRLLEMKEKESKHG